jgi:hypothetical protein
MLLFLELILKMGHDQRDTLKEYLTGLGNRCATLPSYSRVMRRNRFFHILRFLHSENDENVIDRNRDNYVKLWKLRRDFDYLNARFDEVHNPTEQLTIDEIIVKF